MIIYETYGMRNNSNEATTTRTYRDGEWLTPFNVNHEYSRQWCTGVGASLVITPGSRTGQCLAAWENMFLCVSMPDDVHCLSTLEYTSSCLHFQSVSSKILYKKMKAKMNKAYHRSLCHQNASFFCVIYNY